MDPFIIKHTPDQYERLILTQFLKWCTKHSSCEIDLQKLLISKPLFNWWMGQYKKLENEFLTDMNFYPQSSIMDAMIVYGRSVAKIHFIYPKPLIKNALKNDSKTDPKQN